MQDDLSFLVPRTTYLERILPLIGQWSKGRLVVSGSPADLDWAVHRYAPLIQEVAQADVVFVEA